MISLLRRKKDPEPLAPTQEDPVLASPEANRVLLLIPEGAHTCRIASLPDVKSASIYVDTNLVPGQSFHSFWSLDPNDSRGQTNLGEALVMVRDQASPDLVQPYSFADVESARQFIENDAGLRLERDRVLFFWAEPVSIPRGTTPPAVMASAAAARPAPSLQPSLNTPAYSSALAGGAASTTAELTSPGALSRLTSWPGWNGLGPLMVGAALGQRSIYYQILDVDDRYGGRRAGLIVTLGAISAAAGAVGLGGFAPVWYFAGAILGWLLAAAVVYAAALFVPGNRPSDAPRNLPIALGFAYSPALLLFLGMVPVFGPLLLLSILIWIAGTSVVAAMTALELEVETGIVVTFAGWTALFAFTLLVPTLIV